MNTVCPALLEISLIKMAFVVISWNENNGMVFRLHDICVATPALRLNDQINKWVSRQLD
jgi:hypothetical protein